MKVAHGEIQPTQRFTQELSSIKREEVTKALMTICFQIGSEEGVDTKYQHRLKPNNQWVGIRGK